MQALAHPVMPRTAALLPAARPASLLPCGMYAHRSHQRRRVVDPTGSSLRRVSNVRGARSIHAGRAKRERGAPAGRSRRGRHVRDVRRGGRPGAFRVRSGACTRAARVWCDRPCGGTHWRSRQSQDAAGPFVLIPAPRARIVFSTVRSGGAGTAHLDAQSPGPAFRLKGNTFHCEWWPSTAYVLLWPGATRTAAIQRMWAD